MFLLFLCLAYQIYTIPSKETIVNKEKKTNTNKKQNVNNPKTSNKKQNETKINVNKNVSKKNISGKYDTTFHADIKDILKQTNAIKLNTYKKTITNEKGKKVDLILSNTMGNFIYNEPGKYKYGNSNFVPNYPESILLSKTYNNYYAKV